MPQDMPSSNAVDANLAAPTAVTTSGSHISSLANGSITISHTTSPPRPTLGPQTFGDLRSSISQLPSSQQWTIPSHIIDSHQLPSFATGAILASLPLASSAQPINFRGQLSSSLISGPLQSSRQAAWKPFLTPIPHLPPHGHPPHGPPHSRPHDPEGGPTPPDDTPPAAPPRQLSNYVDWRSRSSNIPNQTRSYLCTIQNQNPCQNCWAFAVAGALEALIALQHGLWSKRSEGDIRDSWIQSTTANTVWTLTEREAPCAQFAQVTDTVVWVEGNGACDPGAAEWDPNSTTYNPAPDRNNRIIKIPSHWQVGPNDEKAWLDTQGPLLVVFSAYRDFEGYTASAANPQVYRKTPNAQFVNTHILLIVGYDDRPGRNCWIVRNSWGSSWGDGGYGYFGYGEADIDTYVKIGIGNICQPDPWTRRRVQSGCMIQGMNGDKFQNLEMLRGLNPGSRIQHLSRNDGTTDFNWSVTTSLSTTTSPFLGLLSFGQPALIHSTAGDRNYECVYWELSNNLRHWTYSQTTKVWIDGGSLDTQGRQLAARDSNGTANTAGYPGLIQSNFTSPGNLECVVRTAQGTLQHLTSSGPPGSRTWTKIFEFGANILMSGPALVQSNAGSVGNFYLVCVTSAGQLQLWWKDTSPASLNTTPWHQGETFASGFSTSSPPPPVMVQGLTGCVDETSIGNFDLCIACNGQVEHWQRDNSDIQSVAPANDGSTSAKWRLVDRFGGGMKNVWGLVFASRVFDLECVVEMADGSWTNWAKTGGVWQQVGVLNV